MAQIVTLVVGSKAYQLTRKMAMTAVDLGKQKYKKQNVNAIVGVEKNGIISLQNDVYDSGQELVEAVGHWVDGGYKAYYTVKEGDK